MRNILILPAYNAAKTLIPFLESLPKKIFDEIVIIDDCSTDKTFQVASRIKNHESRIMIFRTPRNLGYGGNLKMCLSLALAHGASTIVELHPDGEYMPDGIVPALEEIRKGAKLVLGNRFDQKLKTQKSPARNATHSVAGGKIKNKIQNSKLSLTLKIENLSLIKNLKLKIKNYPKGMLSWKYLGIRTMNWIHNTILGTTIPDLHQGFRVYTRELLESVDYRSFSNDYLFSFEMIVSSLFLRGVTQARDSQNESRTVREKFGTRARQDPEITIASVPVTAIYKGKKRGASFLNSIKYAVGTFWIILKSFSILNTKYLIRNTDFPTCPLCQNNYFVTSNYHQTPNSYQLYSCSGCQNSFTFPHPKSLDPFYPSSYWQYQGILGKIRHLAFNFFQKRRIGWVKAHVKSGDILDVGSGEGEFGKLIQKSQPMADQPMAEKFKVQSLEPHFSKILNTDVLKTDFLTWNTSKKFNAICFWESLEHVPDPLAYLKKAYALLKKGGHLFIEYPRNGVIESRLFEKYWFHLDIPRHLTHFTRQGMVHALKKAGFHVVSQKSVMSFEYSPGGLFLSCVRLFSNSRSSLNFDLKSLILASPLLPVCLICEIILYIFDQAPIGLLIVKKNEDHKMPNL